MAKPATASVEGERKTLFQKIAAILTPGTGEVSKKDRAAIKKAIISFIRKFPSDTFLSKLSDLPRETLLTLSTQVSGAAEVDLKALVHQVLHGAYKEKVLKKEKVPEHVLKRQWMDIFLEENKDWRDISLADLLSRSYTLTKGSKMETEDNLILVSMILEALWKRPPLPIPRDILNPFLETSQFIPNTDGDVNRFVRQHGLVLLTRKIEQETALGKSKDDIRASITGLLTEMAEKDRRYVKVRFLNLDQVLKMINVYQTKPVDLYVIVNHWVQGRYTKVLGETKEELVVKQKQTAKKKIEYVSFLDSTPKPLLYMIVRPWIKDLKRVLIHSEQKDYLQGWVKDSWYTPSKKFYEDATDPKNTQKGEVCRVKGSAVRILYELYSGKEFQQDEAVFQQEVAYFKSYPAYSIPFLEKASQSVPLADLSRRYLDGLKDMGRSILRSGLAQRLPTSSFDVEQMAPAILSSILEKSHSILDFFEGLFSVVYRLDPAVSELSHLHRVLHERLKRFFYPLSQLAALTDGLAFPEVYLLTDKERAVVSSCYKASKEYFVKKQLYHFRMRLFPLQKISNTLPFPDWKWNVSYPEVSDDLLFQYRLPSTDTVLDLRTVANIFMNDAHVESHHDEVQETAQFFLLDYVYYRDDLETGLFLDYPEYYNPMVLDTAPKTTEGEMDAGEEFPDFWVRFDIFLKQQESLFPGKGKMVEPIVQEMIEMEEEVEEEVGKDEEEQEAGEMEEYPDFLEEEGDEL